MPRKLGKTQIEVLRSLQRHGYWHRNGGWYWGNYSTTLRVMESLVARGDAYIDKAGYYRPTEK